MKKFILSIYFLGLILMLPAIFIGYLYHNNTNDTSNLVKSQATVNSTENSESLYKPGLLFVVKGI